MSIQVHKFGGASVKDASNIRNVGRIISSFDQPVVIVISATGKTTNALEQVVDTATNNPDLAKSELHAIWEQHQEIAGDLSLELQQEFISATQGFVNIAQQHLKKANSLPYDQLYDQVVSLGELLSTKLVSLYLDSQNVSNTWLDVRSLIRTDKSYRDGKIQWSETEAAVQLQIPKLLKSNHVITQGFIGATEDGFTTTLGREGSDYTASILAFCLGAQQVSIWKDVPGVLNADPRFFEQTTKIESLSYKDAIEMTYYGAKVIHPKTIQPLQNKKIPLFVKCFLQPEGSGTVIKDSLEYAFIPPMIVVKPNQVLVHLSTRDFSFIAENHLSYIYEQFASSRVKMNMLQNTAISLRICFDRDERKMEGLIPALQQLFDLQMQSPLRLITLKYYNEDLINDMKRGKRVIIEERMRNTTQLLVEE